MRIKRVHAESMQAALDRIRHDLGPDAVIVSTRPLGTTAEDRRRGLRGVEIIAGIDEQPAPSAVAQARSIAAAAAAGTGVAAVAPGAARAAYALTMAANGGSVGAAAPATPATPDRLPGVRAATAQAAPPAFPRVNRQGNEVPDLNRLVPAREAFAALRRHPSAEAPARAGGDHDRAVEEEALLELIRGKHEELFRGRPSPFTPPPPDEDARPGWADEPDVTGMTAAPALPERPIPASPAESRPRSLRIAPAVAVPDVPSPVAAERVGGASPTHAAAEAVFETLTTAGLSEAVAEQALEAAIRRMPPAHLTDRARLLETALGRLVAGLPAGPELRAGALAGRTLLFTGTAGVGKTTALLKAALLLRRDGADVGVIGADVSRLGATEQLQRYGQVLRLPVHIAYAPEDLGRLLALVSPSRITLVDTAACRPGVGLNGSDLEQLLGIAERALVVLTVPAGSGAGDLRRLATTVRATGAAAIAVTKLDETDSPGPALNVLASLGLPPLLVSTGRDVIGDVQAGSAAALAAALLEQAGSPFQTDRAA